MSITVTDGDIEFVATTTTWATAETELTMTEEGRRTFSFTVERNTLWLRIGTTTGAYDVLPDLAFPPGAYTISVYPIDVDENDITTMFLRWILKDAGIAELNGFALIENTGSLTVEAPYLEADLPSIRIWQNLEAAWMTCPGHEPRVLERYGPNSYGQVYFRPEDGPFDPINIDSELTLASDVQTGEATISSSKALFKTTDAGRLIKLTHGGQYETADLTAADVATSAIRVTGVGDSRVLEYTLSGTFSGTVTLERSIGNESSYQTVATQTSTGTWTLDDELENYVAYYRLRFSTYTSGTAVAEVSNSQGTGDGVARIITVDADNSVTADILEPFTSTEATALWYLGAWSTEKGWPEAVGMMDGRLGMARRDRYWLSKSDDYDKFATGALADDAIDRTLTGAQMNRVRWIRGVRKMVLGTGGGPHVATSGGSAPVLTPDTISSFNAAATRFGAADVEPVVIMDSIIFVSRSRKRIFMFTAGADDERTIPVDLTRLHPSIAGSGDGAAIVEIQFQSEPVPRLWCVRADGKVAVLTMNEVEEIAAWSRLDLDGEVESVCVLPSTPEDEVHFIVKRTIDGSTVRYHEKLAPEYYATTTDACRLWCASETKPDANGVIGGLDHLEGEDVYSWHGGRKFGPLTVSGGEVDLGLATVDTDAETFTGLLYEGLYMSPRLDYGGQMGTTLVANKRIKDIGAILERTPGGFIGFGSTFDAARTHLLKDRRQTSSYDSAIDEHNGVVRLTSLSQEGMDTRLCVVMPGVGPAGVLAIVPYMEVNEK